jgi:hypothetical protein
MDGGTIYLNCRYKDKYFRIVSRQWTIIAKLENKEPKHFLYVNKNLIKTNSNEEKIVLKLIKHSINAADNLWFLPKFIKTLVWSKRHPAYLIEIFKNEILNFADSKEYSEYTKTQAK